MKKILLYSTLFFFLVSMNAHAQNVSTYDMENMVTNQAVQVSYGMKEKGSPYIFNVEAPTHTSSWTLSISEFNGREIFTTDGYTWPLQGYQWTPSETLSLYSSIYYVVSITFRDSNNQVIETDASRFYVPDAMNNNMSPFIFFEADIDVPNTQLYRDSSIDSLITFIVEKAQNEFINTRVLIRGHAAYVTDTPIERMNEQLGLLELSKNRALRVLELLVDKGLDATRIFYEALGGSAQITSDEVQRWKNRRVEIVFLDESTDLDYTRMQPNLDSFTEDTVEVRPEEMVTMDSVEEPQDLIMKQKDMREVVYPWPDIPILGEGQLSAEHMLSFILYNTPTQDERYVEYLRRIILYYITESSREGVNHDIAFAQMILETNYLRFTGNVRREQYNFASIGTTGTRAEGNWFSTELIGIRAHIQHLKGYATTGPLRGALVDPYYSMLDRTGLLGSSPLVSTLAGRWSTDPNYGRDILVLLRKLYDYSNAMQLSR